MIPWRFRPDVEGLRAIAILAVVLYHAGLPVLPGGYLGVDVFFVLSGFLISGVLLDEAARTGTISLRTFWARRARRLLPAAAIVIVVTLLVDALISSPMARAAHGETALAATWYVSNIHFALRSRLYFFADTQGDPLLHTWSLAVEEQFYLAFAPIVLFLTYGIGQHQHHALRRRFSVFVAGAVAASFVASLAVAEVAPVWSFYLLPTRVWEFGVGALCLLLAQRADRAAGVVREVLGVLALVVLVAAMTVGTTSMSHPGTLTLFPVMATAVLIWIGGAKSAPVVSRVLGWRPLRAVGRLSYSWYLWHWPVLVYLQLEVPQASLGLRLGAAFASLIPAVLTYAVIENPIRYSPRLLQRPALVTLWGMLTVTILLSLVASGAVLRAQHDYEQPRFAAVRAARSVPSWTSEECGMEQGPPVFPICSYGAVAGDTTLVLMGDSHAEHWLPAFELIGQRRNWRITLLSKAGCPATSVTVLRSTNPVLGNEACNSWREAALQWIVEEKPTIVVLSSLRKREIVTPGRRSVRADSTAEGRALWRAGLSRTVRTLAESGAQVVVLQDTPYPQIDVPDCVARNLDDPNVCSIPAAHAVDDRVAVLERAAISRLPRTAYVSLNGEICDSSTCAAEAGGLIRYKDTNHLAAPFVKSIHPQLEEALLAVLRSPRFEEK